MNEIPDLSSNSAHGFTEGSELTTARRFLSETPQHVRDEVREIANQQAGRYMSDAEIDADRLALIEFIKYELGGCDEHESDEIVDAYKESLTRIAPENNSPV